MTKKMANLRNTVTDLLITIHSFSYGAFYVCNNLELIRCKSQLIFKILFIFKILSYVSNLSFLASSLFLSLKRHFRVFVIKYPVIAITTSKTSNLQYNLRHLRIIILANLTMPFITLTFKGCCSEILT